MSVERARRRRIEEIGPLGESRAVLLDVSFERMRGACCIPERGASVHAADSEGQLVDDRVRDALPIRHVVESGVLIELPHGGWPILISTEPPPSAKVSPCRTIGSADR